MDLCGRLEWREGLSQVVGSWSSEDMFGDLRNLGVFAQKGKAKRGLDRGV